MDPSAHDEESRMFATLAFPSLHRDQPEAA